MSASGYTRADKLMHRLALSSNVMPDVAFELEKLLHKSSLPHDAGHHVFVSGLARSGSTLLLRLLHASGKFASLTYRDMPFVMAPNLWAGLTRVSQKQGVENERAHGDGLNVGFDSPEAFEEVFWRIKCGSQYLQADSLIPMIASADVIQEFRDYVRLILKRYSASRYLSKNNNNVLRVSSIRKAFPQARILVPFRHPYDQAYSLFTQHQHFAVVQRDDPFAWKYMDWLVHHEFGLSHRPPLFAEMDRPIFDVGDINYWLSLWISTYEGLFSRYGETAGNVDWVCYERLCDQPQSTWATLSETLGLDRDIPTEFKIRPVTPATPEGLDGAVATKALQLYDQLRQVAIR